MILQLYIIGVVSTLFDNTHGLTVLNEESKMKASKTKQLYFRTTGNSYITFCVLIFLNIIKNKNILYICNTVYHKKIIGISQFALLKKYIIKKMQLSGQDSNLGPPQNTVNRL